MQTGTKPRPSRRSVIGKNGRVTVIPDMTASNPVFDGNAQTAAIPRRRRRPRVRSPSSDTKTLDAHRSWDRSRGLPESAIGRVLAAAAPFMNCWRLATRSGASSAAAGRRRQAPDHRRALDMSLSPRPGRTAFREIQPATLRARFDRLTHHVHILEMNGDSYNQSKRRSRRNRPTRPKTILPRPDATRQPVSEGFLVGFIDASLLRKAMHLAPALTPGPAVFQGSLGCRTAPTSDVDAST